FFAGTRGVLQASAAACTGAGHWYWEDNVLYIYYTEDPDGAVDIETIKRDYCINGNSKDYVTIQNIDVKGGKVANILLSGASCIVSSVDSSCAVIDFSVTGNSNSIYSSTATSPSGTAFSIAGDSGTFYWNVISGAGGNGLLVSGASNTLYKFNITTSTSEAVDITGNTNTFYYSLLHSNLDDTFVVTGTSVTIYNNVIFDSGAAGLDADESCTFRNNIVRTSTGDDINIANTKTVTGGYNCFEDAAEAGTGTYTDTGTSTLFSTDPEFIDSASDDFRLNPH
ncbi:unnamed protein product, partial [marine sediment metagenome]